MADKPQVFPFRRAETEEPSKKTAWRRLETAVGERAEPDDAENKPLQVWQKEFWGKNIRVPDVGPVDIFCLAAGVLLGKAEVLGGLLPRRRSSATAILRLFCWVPCCLAVCWLWEKGPGCIWRQPRWRLWCCICGRGMKNAIGLRCRWFARRRLSRLGLWAKCWPVHFQPTICCWCALRAVLRLGFHWFC